MKLDHYVTLDDGCNYVTLHELNVPIRVKNNNASMRAWAAVPHTVRKVHFTYPLCAFVAHRAFTELFHSSWLVAAVRTSSHDTVTSLKTFSSFDKIRITNNPKMFWQPSKIRQKSLWVFLLGPRSNVTSSPTQIPLCAVVNMEIKCSNACRNAGILPIE